VQGRLQRIQDAFSEINFSPLLHSHRTLCSLDLQLPAGCRSLTDTQLGVLRHLSMLQSLDVSFAVTEPHSLGRFMICAWSPAQLSLLLGSDDSPRLQHLSLSGSDLTVPMLPLLCTRLRRLTRVDFRLILPADPPDDTRLEDCAFLLDMADHLQELNVRLPWDLHLSDVCVANIGTCVCLSKLTLHWIELQPAQLQSLLSSLSALTELSLDRVRLISLAPFSSDQTATAAAQSLRTLSLYLDDGQPIPGSETRHLLSLSKLHSLALHASFDPPLQMDVPSEAMFTMPNHESMTRVQVHLPHLEIFRSAKPYWSD
jgi:hypothetical protein